MNQKCANHLHDRLRPLELLLSASSLSFSIRAHLNLLNWFLHDRKYGTFANGGCTDSLARKNQFASEESGNFKSPCSPRRKLTPRGYSSRRFSPGDENFLSPELYGISLNSLESSVVRISKSRRR